MTPPPQHDQHNNKQPMRPKPRFAHLSPLPIPTPPRQSNGAALPTTANNNHNHNHNNQVPSSYDLGFNTGTTFDPWSTQLVQSPCFEPDPNDNPFSPSYEPELRHLTDLAACFDNSVSLHTPPQTPPRPTHHQPQQQQPVEGDFDSASWGSQDIAAAAATTTTTTTTTCAPHESIATSPTFVKQTCCGPSQLMTRFDFNFDNHPTAATTNSTSNANANTNAIAVLAGSGDLHDMRLSRPHITDSPAAFSVDGRSDTCGRDSVDPDLDFDGTEALMGFFPSDLINDPTAVMEVADGAGACAAEQLSLPGLQRLSDKGEELLSTRMAHSPRRRHHRTHASSKRTSGTAAATTAASATATASASAAGLGWSPIMAATTASLSTTASSIGASPRRLSALSPARRPRAKKRHAASPTAATTTSSSISISDNHADHAGPHNNNSSSSNSNSNSVYCDDDDVRSVSAMSSADGGTNGASGADGADVHGKRHCDYG